MALSPDLKKIFPLTFSLLPMDAGASLQREFEVDWGLGKLHFFPMLIRHKKYSPQIQEIADYEYLRYWLQSESFSDRISGAHLILNPSLQFLLVHASAETLKKEPGVYLLWKCQSEVLEKKATREEADLLDRLRDDQMVFLKDLSELEQLTIQEMRSLGIVFTEAGACS